MADRSFYGDQVIRWITTMSVIVLAGIAAVISYKHMHALVLEYGETSWTAALLPLSVDGMIATSSMTLLADSRQGRRSGFLPWALLVIGSAASLAANVAVAEPSAVGRLIAAWPSAALIGSYELLMRQVRHGSRRELTGVSPAPPMSAKPSGSATDKSSYEAVAKAGEPYEAPPTRQVAQGSSYDVQMDSAKSVIRNADEPRGSVARHAVRARSQPRRPAAGLQHQAWQWAVANRSKAGDLPSGKAIAEHFGRRERWGRLVKQAGLAGRLESVSVQR